MRFIVVLAYEYKYSMLAHQQDRPLRSQKPCTMHVRAELRHQQHEAEHFTGIIKAEHFITLR